jgi:hypothetical protein
MASSPSATTTTTRTGSPAWQSTTPRLLDTEILLPSLAGILNASAAAVMPSPTPKTSQQKRRKSRRKRRRRRNAPELSVGNVSFESSQSDTTSVCPTPVLSDTEEHPRSTSRPGTPTNSPGTSLRSPAISPAISPTMSPMYVDELDMIESNSGRASPALGYGTKDGSKWRRENNMPYGRINETHRARPCSPLRLAHFSIERPSSALSNHSDRDENERSNMTTHTTHDTTTMVTSTTQDTVHITSTTKEGDRTITTEQTCISVTTCTSTTMTRVASSSSDSNTDQTSERVVPRGHISDDDDEAAYADDDADADDDDDDENDEDEPLQHSLLANDAMFDHALESHVLDQTEQPYVDGECNDDSEIDEDIISEMNDAVPELPNLKHREPLTERWERRRRLEMMLAAAAPKEPIEWPSEDDELQQASTGNESDGVEDERLVVRTAHLSMIEQDAEEMEALQRAKKSALEEADALLNATSSLKSTEPILSQGHPCKLDEGIDEGDGLVLPAAVMSELALSDNESASSSSSERVESRFFERVRSKYLEHQNQMLVRELECARNTAQALRDIVRSLEKRIREDERIKNDLRARIRSLELSVTRELADLQQRRHHVLPMAARKRPVLNVASRRGHASSATDGLVDTGRRREKTTSDDKSRGGGSACIAWQAPPPLDNASATKFVQQSHTEVETTISVESTTTITESEPKDVEAKREEASKNASSPSPNTPGRRDLSAIWRDFRAESRTASSPIDDEGYGSGNSTKKHPDCSKRCHSPSLTPPTIIEEQTSKSESQTTATNSNASKSTTEQNTKTAVTAPTISTSMWKSVSTDTTTVTSTTITNNMEITITATETTATTATLTSTGMWSTPEQHSTKPRPAGVTAMWK